VPEPEEVRRIFGRFEQESPQIDTGDGRRELDIPDLQAKDELRAFVASHSSVVFPVPEEEEHAFMGLRMYWKSESSME